jgi:serine/threonine protein kinase
VVHGDLNPGNIFVTNEGEIRVLDFGAARAWREGPTVSAASTDRAPVATPRFASPQVLDGQRPDARDDVYSLACLSYVLLSGKHPFGEKTALGAAEQRLRPSRPAELNWREWRALRAGLAFDRERRPSDVTQWLSAFDWSKAAARLPPLLTLVRVPPRRRPRWAAPALGTAAVLAAVAAALWARAYFDAGGPTPTGDSATQSDAPPPQSDGSAAQPTPPTSSTATQPTPTAHSTATQPPPPARSAAGQPTATAPAATPGPTPPPPSSPANARTRLAASSRGVETVETSALPRSRVELAADTIDVPLTDPAARIVVRRRGSLQGDATFTWWTESGTAKPGQDFMAVSPHQEVIEDGKSSVSLFIPVVGDATRQQPKSFYVVINDPGPGVTLGARTLTMVTIPPSQ